MEGEVVVDERRMMLRVGSLGRARRRRGCGNLWDRVVGCMVVGVMVAGLLDFGIVVEDYGW